MDKYQSRYSKHLATKNYTVSFSEVRYLNVFTIFSLDIYFFNSIQDWEIFYTDALTLKFEMTSNRDIRELWEKEIDKIFEEMIWEDNFDSVKWTQALILWKSVKKY